MQTGIKIKLSFSIFFSVLSILLVAQKVDHSTNSDSLSFKDFDIRQFINRDIDRSSLSNWFNYQPLATLALNGRYTKIISSNKKQITLFSKLSLIFPQDRGLSLKFGRWSPEIGGEVKFFDKRNWFIGVGLSNEAFSFQLANGFSLSTNHILEISTGKGRIDPVNDVHIAQLVVREILKSNCLRRSLSKDEFSDLVSIIVDIKNERYFANRSYSMLEAYQIAMYLESIGAIEKDIENLAPIIHKPFKYEPILERSSGSQWKAALSTIYRQIDFFQSSSLPRYNLSLNLESNKYINANWQWNKSASLATTYSKKFVDFGSLNFLIYQINNQFDYYINEGIVLSLKTTINSQDAFFAGEDPRIAVKKRLVRFNNSFDLNYQMNRINAVYLSVGFSIFSNTNTYLECRAGFRF